MLWSIEGIFSKLDFDLRSVKENIDAMKIGKVELKIKNFRKSGISLLIVPSKPELDGQCCVERRSWLLLLVLELVLWAQWW